jgi:short-subunit dehydrogenase
VKRVTFITGASSGIGRALALLLSKDGPVALVARRKAQLEDAATEIRAAGGISLPIVCDVSKREEVFAAVQQCEQELAPVDCLIAGAGIGGVTGPESFDAELVERIVQTNLLGPAYCIAAVMPGMIARRNGHIVGISSIAAFRGLPNAAAYCATKAGLNIMLESLRVGLRRHNVFVTTVCPGFVKTPMTEGRRDPMPFLMPVEKAAEAIYDAIRRKKRVHKFPWPLALMMRIGQSLPDALYDRALSGGLKLKKERK